MSSHLSKQTMPHSKQSSLASVCTDLARYPLLKRDREIELAMIVQRDYVPYVDRKDLTDAEAKTLARGREALDLMVYSNLRWVVEIVKKYYAPQMEFADLYQEGAIGLRRAVEKFVPDRNCKLCTYSTFWIRQSINRAIANQSRTIRWPVHIQEIRSRIRREAPLFMHEHKRQPSTAELAQRCKCTQDQIEKAIAAGSTRTTSLDLQIGQEGDMDFSQAVADPNAVNVLDQAIASEEFAVLQSMLCQLTDREQQILMMQYGVGGYEPSSLAEIGSEIGLSRERVRQIQSKAMRKLREIARQQVEIGRLDRTFEKPQLTAVAGGKQDGAIAS